MIQKHPKRLAAANATKDTAATDYSAAHDQSQTGPYHIFGGTPADKFELLDYPPKKWDAPAPNF